MTIFNTTCRLFFSLTMLFFAVVSCGEKQKPGPNPGKQETKVAKDDEMDPEKDGSAVVNEELKVEKRPDLDSVIRTAKTNFGYRFQVTGDFDGDGKKETLTEHYVSQITNREMNKYFVIDDNYNLEVELATYRMPYSFVSSSNSQINVLPISKDAQLFGLRLLKNEGDLDGNGADELSYVISWADWSSSNYWHLVSYKNGKWVELYSFAIRDTEIPYLPEYYDESGSFLKSNKVTIPVSDTMNRRKENELLQFEGWVKKAGNKKIEVTFLNEESDEETKIVNLKR